ncbi:hypothetical protein HC891_21465, partial [Candidatus Gracilibacteria bacterium]|nr:hypothetical protein [Candidatus Gracilibacteria bacterium]
MTLIIFEDELWRNFCLDRALRDRFFELRCGGVGPRASGLAARRWGWRVPIDALLWS